MDKPMNNEIDTDITLEKAVKQIKDKKGTYVEYKRPSITAEQKQAAHEVDLVSYLESKGYELNHRGNSYKIKISKPYSGDMSSLSIFDDRRGWKRWSSGEHGGDAISFLQLNMGMSFQEAVLELNGSGVAAYIPPPPKADNHIHETKDLVLPKKCDGKYSRAFAYLNKTRFIDSQVISKMISDKKIFQDDHNNVVFVGYNEEKKAAFACVRGTNTKVQYRGDCDGSDKRYAFSMEGKGSSGKLYVFEAPIDLLSHATMANKITGKEDAWTAHSRISLAGTSDVALEHYLSSHPEVKEIHFVLDNDKAGREAVAKYKPKYEEKGYKVVDHILKNKDMNDELKAYINAATVKKNAALKI